MWRSDASLCVVVALVVRGCTVRLSVASPRVTLFFLWPDITQAWVCVFSTSARDADSGCVIETWQACASGFRRPGVEELQSEAEWGAAWCRWADALAMIKQRHPAVATPLIGQATIQDTCWGPLNRANVWVMGSTIQSGARSFWENIVDSNFPFRMGRA